MKKKQRLELRKESIRHLSAASLRGVGGGGLGGLTDDCVSNGMGTCRSIMSQASICDGWGSWG